MVSFTLAYYQPVGGCASPNPIMLCELTPISPNQFNGRCTKNVMYSDKTVLAFGRRNGVLRGDFLLYAYLNHR